MFVWTFQLKTWEPNNKIVVEKNPHYWDAETVKLNEMHFYPVSNVMTEDECLEYNKLLNFNFATKMPSLY